MGDPELFKIRHDFSLQKSACSWVFKQGERIVDDN